MTNTIKVYLRFRKIFIVFANIFLLCLFILIANGLLEFSVVENKIDYFMSRGEFIETIVVKERNIDVYKVKKEADFELNTEVVFDYQNNYYIGNTLDITITSRNPLRYHRDSIIKDITRLISKYSYIGHASINISQEEIIESVGNDEDKLIRIKENTWFLEEIMDSMYEVRIIGLRIKYLDKNLEVEMIEELLNYVGLKYSLIGKKSYYCTELITDFYKKYGYNLNYDSFFSIGNDLIVDDDLFITFVFDRSNDKKFKIYYLGD